MVDTQWLYTTWADQKFYRFSRRLINGCGVTEFFVFRLGFQTVIIIIPVIIHRPDSDRYQQVDNFHRSNKDKFY